VKRGLLRALGRGQRPVAWVVFVGAIVLFFSVLFDVISTGDAKWATMLAAICVVQQGWDTVVSVENEIDSEGSAEE
jgi:hypothetical protein